ncbi:MAG: Hsp20 family protein, partial [Candidatus Bathyarchaeia archaeon]
IRAERKEEKEEKRRNYIHRERAYSSIQRYIAFPEEVIPAKAEGSMKDGVLELKVPKKEPKAAETPHKVELK